MKLTFVVTAKDIDENIGEALIEDCINMIKSLAVSFGDGDIVCNKNQDTGIEANLSVNRNEEQSTHIDVKIF